MISLFTGAGGLDYGFEAAGFRTDIAVEIDHDCCETIQANREWPLINKDIHETTSREILDTAGLTVGDVDLIIGGPPCQPFSKSGYWVNGSTARLDDPRADTLYAYMRCVADILPQVFLLENVHGINYSGKEDGFRLIEALTKEINHKSGTNYRLSWQVVNAADFGIPQTRRRFFLVAHRDGKIFKFPAQTHVPLDENCDLLDEEDRLVEEENHLQTTPSLQKSLFQSDLISYVTAWDAIGGLDLAAGEDLKIRGKWADLLPSIPEGQNYLWHTNRKEGVPLFGWRTRYWSFLLKLAKNRPSWTIQAQPGPSIGPFHWANRLLSVSEMARLQTFPKDIIFCGNRTSIQSQIGNAVPSLMSEIIAREIASQFFDRLITRPLQFAIDLQRPIPSPEPAYPVPEKYLGFRGEHPDHPGEGKGPGVSKRLTKSRARFMLVN